MSWWVVVVVVVVVVGVALDRVLLALEARGHIYWRKTSARGAAGTALMSLQAFMEPQAAALVEQQREDEERQDVDDLVGRFPHPPLQRFARRQNRKAGFLSSLNDADDAHRPRL